jgi:hypothetical protein
MALLFITYEFFEIRIKTFCCHYCAQPASRVSVY